MDLARVVHRAGSRLRQFGPLGQQAWFWRVCEPMWNGVFDRVTRRQGYLTSVNGDAFRLDYAYGARYDRQDKREYEPTFYLPFAERIRPGMVVFDVGAHVGFFSLAAGLRVGDEGRVVAFECSPDTAALLRRHIAYNRVGHRVSVVEKAVSDSEGRLQFFAYRASMAASMARANVESLNPEHLEEPLRELTVKSVTIDAFCGQHGLRPSIIKIDVEGAELRVLQGCQRTLREVRPEVFCEIHPRQLANCGGSIDELRALVSAVGYTMQPLDDPNPAGIFHARLQSQT